MSGFLPVDFAISSRSSRLPAPSVFAALPSWAAGPSTEPGSEIRFRRVRAPERLDEILDLRRRAFGVASEAGSRGAPGEPEEPRDAISSFVIAELGDRLVGTVRLTLPPAGPVLHHTSRVIGSLRDLPARSDYLETSRACIDPEHQGQGLFWHLAAHMLIAALEFRRPFLVAGTTPQLLTAWRRCGFSPIGARYRRAGSEAEYQVVVLDLEDVLTRRQIAPQLAEALSAHRL